MTTTSDESRPSSVLEIWSANERMRHVPPTDWIARKIDADVRRRAQHVLTSAESLPAEDPRRAEIETALESLCAALEQLADVARRPRAPHHPPHRLRDRLPWAIELAAGAVSSMDPETAGRRLPFQTFERSNSEPLFASLLTVISRLQRAIPLARAVDPGLDERLLENLVTLQNPVDDRMLRPIA